MHGEAMPCPSFTDQRVGGHAKETSMDHSTRSTCPAVSATTASSQTNPRGNGAQQPDPVGLQEAPPSQGRGFPPPCNDAPKPQPVFETPCQKRFDTCSRSIFRPQFSYSSGLVQSYQLVCLTDMGVLLFKHQVRSHPGPELVRSGLTWDPTLCNCQYPLAPLR